MKAMTVKQLIKKLLNMNMKHLVEVHVECPDETKIYRVVSVDECEDIDSGTFSAALEAEAIEEDEEDEDEGDNGEFDPDFCICGCLKETGSHTSECPVGEREAEIGKVLLKEQFARLDAAKAAQPKIPNI
jgi:hypothetical protein